jgi:hypothetical protein
MTPEETRTSPEAETISGRDNLKQTGREAMDAARERADDLQHRATKAVGDMGVAAQEKTEEAKGRAADEINRTAEGLEAAAEDLEGSPLPQDLLREAAGGLRQISQAISKKSIGELTSDLSDFARRNPVSFLGGAAFAGFALARFARADRPVSSSYSSSYRREETSAAPYGTSPTGFRGEAPGMSERGVPAASPAPATGASAIDPVTTTGRTGGSTDV